MISDFYGSNLFFWIIIGETRLANPRFGSLMESLANVLTQITTNLAGENSHALQAHFIPADFYQFQIVN